MSLQFIAGEAGSGKTGKMHAQILERAASYPDRNFLILVPEQFNMQTQRDIVQKSPNKGIMNIDVLSFSRLAHRIFDEAGVSSGVMLGDTGKSMILRALASRHKDELKTLKGKLDKSGCIDELKSVISEFMQYDLSPEAVLDVAQTFGEKTALGEKLGDIEFLYDRMLTYLRERYIVPEELLDKAILVSDKAAFLEDCELYLDNYTGFTPIQLRFLSYMMRRSKRVVTTVTLGRELIKATGGFAFDTDTTVLAPETELFSLGINTVRQLTDLACQSPEVEIEEPVTLSSQFRFSAVPELSFLSENLFRPRQGRDPGTYVYNESVTSISVSEASDIAHEAEHVSREIVRLVRDNKAKFGDIAVLTGDVEEYGRFLMTEMVKYEIPFFIDERRSFSLNPLSELIGSIVDMTATSYSYQSVFRFLKTGFVPFERDEIMLMENYVLAAGIRRRTDYMKEWTYRPYGHEDDALMEKLNALRERFVLLTKDIMEGFGPKRKDEVTELVRTLYGFLEKLDIYGTLKERSESFLRDGDKTRADEYSQMYAALISLFDQCIEFLEGEKISVSELGEILDSGLAEVSVGILPPGSDRVIIGDIERCRIGEVRYLFLMGVNDSVIPRDVKKTGLLSELDRRLLKEKGMVLSESTEAAAFIQRFYLYMYLTKAGKGLFLSYSVSASDGSRRIPSYLIRTLLDMYKTLRIYRIPDSISMRDIYTRREGLYLLALGMCRGDDPLYPELFSYFGGQEEYRSLLKRMIDHAFRIYVHDPITKAAAEALYGSILISSVSRLEKYAACGYSHFLSFGLRLRERREPDFGTGDLGTVCHEILKVYVDLVTKETKGDWKSLDEVHVGLLTQKAMDEVLDRAEKVTALGFTARNAYMEKRIRRIMKKNIEVITYQIQQGDFVPRGTEYRFKNDTFNGIIDRFDVFRGGNDIFLRVVDYKTGDTKLDPVEVYDGCSLQLPIYLGQAAGLLSRENPGALLHQSGLFYFNIHDPLISLSVNEELSPQEMDIKIKDELSLSGLLDRDPEVIAHMDNHLEGRSHVVNVRLKKDGQPDAKSQVADGEMIDAMTKYARNKARELAEKIAEGNIKVFPYSHGDKNACRWCRYGAICGFDSRISGFQYNEASDLTKEEAMESFMKPPIETDDTV